MKTCATCRLWVPSVMKNRFGSCHGVEFDGMGRYSSSKKLAIVADGSGYAAGLYTKPSFGCVLHESKEAT